MKQKFGKLSFVHVTKDMPVWMSHFDSDFDAIIDGTYSQIYGGNDINSYSLFKIENGKIVDHLSWYEECQLSMLPEQDREKAESMIEKYNMRGGMI